MARVLVSDKLSEKGVEILRRSPNLDVDYKPGLSEADLAATISGYDALVIRSGSKVTAKVIEAADKLRVIGRAGIGVDNVDVTAASKRGIVVMNTPTGNAVTTAEHAITLLLSLARKVPQATASMRNGKWEKSKFEGREISDKTLGIVGLGNIGRIVADRAKGLRLNVIAFDPAINPEIAERQGVELVDFNTLLARADFISIHAPLTADTKNLFNDETLAKLRPHCLLVNAARGGIVDENALLKALQSGKIAGAALDVFEQEPPPADHPLLKLDNVICTPHLGASTEEAQERVANEIAEQVVAFLNDGVIKNAVNVPALPKEVAVKLDPWLELAKRLGLLLGQLGLSDIRELRVTCSGEPGDLGVKPIARAALAGYLARYHENPVSPISAPYEAKERGIALVEVAEQSLSRGFTSAIRITLKGTRSINTATGTLGAAGEPRLVGLDGYEIDAMMQGTTLVMYNEDRPGVIGAVGTILGKRNINISRMQVGLDPANRRALALWNADSDIPSDVLAELRTLDNVSDVRVVKLS